MSLGAQLGQHLYFDFQPLVGTVESIRLANLHATLSQPAKDSPKANVSRKRCQGESQSDSKRQSESSKGWKIPQNAARIDG